MEIRNGETYDWGMKGNMVRGNGTVYIYNSAILLLDKVSCM